MSEAHDRLNAPIATRDILRPPQALIDALSNIGSATDFLGLKFMGASLSCSMLTFQAV